MPVLNDSGSSKQEPAHSQQKDARMPRRQTPLPLWMQNPSELERQILAAQTGDRALVRRTRLSYPFPEHSALEVHPLYVQRGPGGVPSLLALDGDTDFAEFSFSRSYCGDGEFVTGDYQLTVYGIVRTPADVERVMAEAHGRIAQENARTQAESAAILGSVRESLGESVVIG